MSTVVRGAVAGRTSWIVFVANGASMTPALCFVRCAVAAMRHLVNSTDCVLVIVDSGAHCGSMARSWRQLYLVGNVRDGDIGI